MRHFPVFLDLHGRAVLVVGDGVAAAAKVELLDRAGATVTLVAQSPSREIRAIAQHHEITVKARRFRPADVSGNTLVVAAGDETSDQAVAHAAKAAGIPVNVVDNPTLSSFIMPALIDRDPVLVAISTGGAAPALARRLRARIEALLPPGLGRLARFAESFRRPVKEAVVEPVARRRFWDAFFAGPVAEKLLHGEPAGTRATVRALIAGASNDAGRQGRVDIVGAGPGNPELMSLRALRLLQEADVILHDRLIDPAILDYARREAIRIDAGKSPGADGIGQDATNRLMRDHARAGKRVLRLKGGDPFTFGRGGEEAAYLRAHGIPVAVTPGITAASGAAAAIGVPLTDRDFASAVTFLTGHAVGGGLADADWPALARGGQTIVVYMGRAQAGPIAARLIAHGMAPSMPAAIIRNATLADQRTATTTLARLAPDVAALAGDGPILIVIGEVVRRAGGAESEMPAAIRAAAS